MRGSSLPREIPASGKSLTSPVVEQRLDGVLHGAVRPQGLGAVGPAEAHLLE